jgi:hypothetical protein
MIQKPRYYRLAFYLTATFAVLWLYPILTEHRQLGVATAVPLVFLLGLWIGNSFVRYLAVVWFLGTCGLVVWLVVSTTRIETEFWPNGVWWIAVFVVGALACWLLLLSRRFASEFAHQRETLPPYKKVLRGVMVAAIVVTLLVATAIDIHHLMTL